MVRLTTVGLCIGWIGFGLSAFMVAVFVTCFNRMDELARMIAERMDNPEASYKRVHTTLLVICGLYLGVNLINLMASALLICGILREKYVLLVPWLYNSGIWLFFNFVYFIYFATFSPAPNNSVSLPVISAGLTLIFHLGIWCTVYALYQYMQNDRESQKLLQSIKELRLYDRKERS